MIELKAREHFKSFPWVTYGRIELSSDFFRKADTQYSTLRFMEPRVTFSVVVLVPEKTRLKYLRECLYGLLLQNYREVEVIVVSHADLRDWRMEFSDSRIRWVRRENATSARMMGEGARAATGEWLTFVDSEDVLSPVALFHFAREIHKQPDLALVYSNEAGINDSATRISGIYSKPAFTWFNLIHFNGMGRAWAVKKSVLDHFGGFTERLDLDHDLFLRICERNGKVASLPAVLYYRRSEGIPWKRPIRKTIEEHLDRKDIKARVVNGDTWKVVPSTETLTKVSVIVGFKNKSELTIQCLKSLSMQQVDFPMEVILVDNRSSLEELARVEKFLATFPYPWKILKYDEPFNFADMNNRAALSVATGEIIVLLNNDVHWVSSSAIAELSAWAAQSWVGTVGALLRYPDGKIQHGGFSVLKRTAEDSPFWGHAVLETDAALQTREVVGSSFAAVAIRRTVFESIGGLRPLEYPNAFGDVAFNLECLKRGWTNLYLATVEGVHHESATRGRNFEFWEERDVLSEYSEILAKNSQNEMRWDTRFHQFSLKSAMRDAVRDGITRVSSRSRRFENLFRRFPRLDALLTNQR